MATIIGDLMKITTFPATVEQLLALLKELGPFVEGPALRFRTAPPRPLVPSIRALQSGLRAVLTGQTWWGCGETVATARPTPLNPAQPIPRWVTLMAAEGDAKWDRIRSAARRGLPHLFATK